MFACSRTVRHTSFCLQTTQYPRSLSSKINNAELPPKAKQIGEFIEERMKELGTSLHDPLKERIEIMFKAAKEGKISVNTPPPFLSLNCTLEEAGFVVSGEWEKKENHALLCEAEKAGRLILPLDMPSKE
ncbi:MAG: hypothetical protein K2X08_08080 [Chlamydiales bacterium]|nr:hypothetical protein [Chlamydiales bacterium]